MHLIRLNDAPFVEGNLEERRYYLPDRDPLEVIETRMSANASQSAHSHDTIREAMLVLEGTVRVEEVVAGITSSQILNVGDFVVFDRGVLHRMENESNLSARTLHFKFLGEGKDRALFADDKNTIEVARTQTAAGPDIYTQDYRHFDNLIWQVPAWASAIFSFAITASVLVLANGKSIEAFLSLPISAPHSVSVFLFAIFFVLLLLINVFLRFRLHQRVAPRPNRRYVPALWYMVSGQTSLLLVLFVEAATIFCFALVTAGVPPIFADCVAAILFGTVFSYVEWSVRKLSATLREDRERTRSAG
jgi:quercetin dioxygenase-like cupin family protein